MLVINAKNVHQALPLALDLLQTHGVNMNSRNGGVRKFPGPVTTVYENPTQRVLFWPQRDANPFFHLEESLWMLAGRNDVEHVAKMVERMRTFSDDGVTFHGAYGYRWRQHFDSSTVSGNVDTGLGGLDQLSVIIEALKQNPEDRRQVLSMWDANVDLGRQGKDLPCNLQAVFQINHYNQLDMMVTNRSNDLVWGCYGANAVHFSFLQEYVARRVGVAVGTYYQVSFNLHMYDAVADQVATIPRPDAYAGRMFMPALMSPYESHAVMNMVPLINGDPDEWDEDLHNYMEHLPTHDRFFKVVAEPMREAYRAFKHGGGVLKYDQALRILESVEADDWHIAASEWITRRRDKFLRANDDGVNYESGQAQS